MKKLSILFAVIALALNVAVANTNTVDPSAKAKVKVEHNGFNLMKVSIDKVEDEKVRIKIYDNDFVLIHTETLKGETATKGFDISELEKGHYLVKVTVEGKTIYTETIEKIK